MTRKCVATQTAPLRPCNLCDGDDVQPIVMLRTNGLVALRCRECGMVYIGNNPVKDEELSSLYTFGAFQGERHLQSKEWYKGYYANGLAGYDPKSEVILHFDRTLDVIGAKASKGRLLDIGCATGVFLDRARKRGYEPVGVDFSSELVDYARREFSLDARLGTLEDQAFPDAHFDVVTMLDVIEHIPRYEGLFPELRRVLKPGGLLLLRTPTEDALMRSFAKLLHRASFGRFELPMLWFYSFEHVNSFSEETLRKLLEKFGFEVEEAYDESETPERLTVPGVVKMGLRVFEAVAGLVSCRHKIVIIGRRPS